MNIHTIDPVLDWEVRPMPLYSESGELISNYKRLVHSETQQTLHICKDSYAPIENSRLTQLATTLAENHDFTLEGYASFKGGLKVLAYLKNEQNIKLAGFPCDDYLIIGNSHDGSSSFFVGASNYMYRCENMFTSTKQHWKVNHRKGYSEKLDDLEGVYDLYFNKQTGMYEQLEKMGDMPTTTELTEEFTNHVLQIEKGEPISTRMLGIQEQLNESIVRECGEVGNNVFGLFNGVTHYTSHVLNQKNNVFGNVFGHANTLNQRAFDFCSDAINSVARIHIVNDHF